MFRLVSALADSATPRAGLPSPSREARLSRSRKGGGGVASATPVGDRLERDAFWL
jgi:hypothetical protein